MAQKSLLITRPFYENPTNYLYYWSKPLIKFAQNKRFIVIDLAKEKIAALFMEPSNQTVKSLLKGNSAKKSNENGKNAFLKNILELLTSETKKEESDTVRYLIWDMRHQVCLGNPDAIV